MSPTAFFGDEQRRTKTTARLASFTFECLEDRRLLASHFSVIHEVGDPAVVYEVPEHEPPAVLFSSELTVCYATDSAVAVSAAGQLLDNNLQVVDLSDLTGDLPLNVTGTTQILQQTQNWEHSTLGNPSWPADGHESLGYPTMVKNTHGRNQDGKYYLYYAHHDPTSGIGSAVANSITGPYIKAAVPHSVLGTGWTDSQVLVNPLYRPGGMPVDWIGHYSSPSVVWNEDEDLWFMYFHYYNHYWGGAGDPPGEAWSTNNPGMGRQMTGLATTPDLSSHDWTIWTDPVWSRVSAHDIVPVLPTTDAAWASGASSYNGIQRLPDGQWLAFVRGTNDSTGLPTVGFATSNDGRNWDYFSQNPVIAPGKSWTVDTSEYRPKFVGYLGENGSGEDEYLVAWAEHSNPHVIYSTTTDFKTFQRDSRGYANWGTGDGGIVNARREGDRLYLFSGKNVHAMTLSVTSNSPPTISGSLVSANLQADRATISWGKSTDADGDDIDYEIQYRKDGLSGNWSSTLITGNTSYTLTGLQENTSYHVRVRAFDGALYSAWRTGNNLFTTTLDNQPPTSPGPLSAMFVSGTTALVRWETSTDPNGDSLAYQVEYRKSDLGDSWTSTVLTTALGQPLSGLQEGTSYRVRVRAFDGTLYSDWRESANLFTTTLDNQPPTSPGPLSAMFFSGTTALVRWETSTDPNHDPLAYQIEYRKSDLSDSWTHTVFTTALGQPLSGLQEGTSYRVRVRAFDGALYSDWRESANLFTTLGVTVPGDVNDDGVVNADDIDLVQLAVRTGSTDLKFDLDSNSLINSTDVSYLVETILNTRFGDLDLDFDVDTIDLTVRIINFTGASGSGKGWREGDLDGDTDVDTADLTRAIINFTGAAARLSSPLPMDLPGSGISADKPRTQARLIAEPADWFRFPVDD